MSGKSIYEANIQQMESLFADYLEGDADRPVLVMSPHPVSEEVRSALEKSCAAFGYTAPACSYVSLYPRDSSVEGGDIPLDEQALFLLIESLDPLQVIATHEQAVCALQQTYHTQYERDCAIRVFGRQSVAFSNLDELLTTPQGKQKAWKVLKSLQA